MYRVLCQLQLRQGAHQGRLRAREHKEEFRGWVPVLFEGSCASCSCARERIKDACIHEAHSKGFKLWPKPSFGLQTAMVSREGPVPAAAVPGSVIKMSCLHAQMGKALHAHKCTMKYTLTQIRD